MRTWYPVQARSSLCTYSDRVGSAVLSTIVKVNEDLLSKQVFRMLKKQCYERHVRNSLGSVRQ